MIFGNARKPGEIDDYGRANTRPERKLVFPATSLNILNTMDTNPLRDIYIQYDIDLFPVGTGTAGSTFNQTVTPDQYAPFLPRENFAPDGLDPVVYNLNPGDIGALIPPFDAENLESSSSSQSWSNSSTSTSNTVSTSTSSSSTGSISSTSTSSGTALSNSSETSTSITTNSDNSVSSNSMSTPSTSTSSDTTKSSTSDTSSSTTSGEISPSSLSSLSELSNSSISEVIDLSTTTSSESTQQSTSSSTGIEGADLFYDFEGVSGSNIPDASGNGHTATLTDGATIGTSNLGKGLDVSGATNKYAPTTWTRDGASQVSVSTWFYLSAAPTVNDTVFGDMGSSGATASMRLTLSFNNSTQLRIVTGDGSGSSAWWAFNQTATLTTGVWHHAVLIADGDQRILYFNNSKIIDQDSGLTLPPNESVTWPAGTWTLGRDGDWAGTNYYFNGEIGCTRIYKRALTATDVSNLFNEGASHSSSSS